MPTKILIPTPLRRYARDSKVVEVNASTVREALRALVEEHEELGRHIFQDDGELRSFVNVYVNDEDIRSLNKQDTEITSRDVVSIVPAVAGGGGLEGRNGESNQEVAAGSPPAEDRLGAGPADIKLSHEEIRRYSRHLILPEVGVEGQKKLKGSSVLLVGTGGLGSPLAMYLAAAGVGRIGLVDFDQVDESNLQRQILHGTRDVGTSKLESARATLHDLNPHVEIETHAARLSRENALEILRDYDVVADGTDNFPTRYLVNDACVLLGKPNAYGSIFRFEGQASVFWAERGPCYRCLYPEPPPPGLVPSCAEGGVLGVLPGIVGVIQATEAIKILLGKGDLLVGRLLLFDALAMSFREMRLRKNPDCPVCGERPTVTELIDYEGFCGISPEEEVVGRISGELEPFEISVLALRDLIAAGAQLQLVDIREPNEWEICGIEGDEKIPMNSIPDSLDRLERDVPLVCYCHRGIRSATVVSYLQRTGFENARSLAGGIDDWAVRVDPSLPRY